MKEKFIRAYMYSFGTTKKEAMQTYKECIKNGKTGYIAAIIQGYEQNSRKAFYED